MNTLAFEKQYVLHLAKLLGFAEDCFYELAGSIAEKMTYDIEVHPRLFLHELKMELSAMRSERKDGDKIVTETSQENSVKNEKE